MSERPFVKNAADESQLKEAARREKNSRERELNDIRHVLASVEGRRLIWRLLTHTRVFGTVWEPSAKIHYNAGQQDVGHFILAEVTAAREAALLEMMKESKGDPNV